MIENGRVHQHGTFEVGVFLSGLRNDRKMGEMQTGLVGEPLQIEQYIGQRNGGYVPFPEICEPVFLHAGCFQAVANLIQQCLAGGLGCIRRLTCLLSFLLATGLDSPVVTNQFIYPARQTTGKLSRF